MPAKVGQRFLGDAAFRAQRTYRYAESLGQLGVKGGGAGRSAALDGSLRIDRSVDSQHN